MNDHNPPLHASLVDAPGLAATPHLRKAAIVLSNWAARAAGNGIATAQLLAFRMNPQTWNELWQMQQAIGQRQRQLQNNWLQAWTAWTTERTQIRGANTMSKLVEQEFDLIAQLHELLSDQATDWVSLLENIDVDYSYWVNEKLR